MSSSCMMSSFRNVTVLTTGVNLRTSTDNHQETGLVGQHTGFCQGPPSAGFRDGIVSLGLELSSNSTARWNVRMIVWQNRWNIVTPLMLSWVSTISSNMRLFGGIWHHMQFSERIYKRCQDNSCSNNVLGESKTKSP